MYVRRAASALVALALSVMPVSAQNRDISTIRDAEIERTLHRMGEPIFAAAGLQPDTVEIFIIQRQHAERLRGRPEHGLHIPAC